MRDPKTAAKRTAPKILLGTAVALAMAAGTAHAGDSVKTVSTTHWTKVDQTQAILWTDTRQPYRVTFTEACTVADYGRRARVAATWNGRLKGAMRDRMIFDYTSCYIGSVEKLDRTQVAQLLDGTTQLAAARLSR